MAWRDRLAGSLKEVAEEMQTLCANVTMAIAVFKVLNEAARREFGRLELELEHARARQVIGLAETLGGGGPTPGRLSTMAGRVAQTSSWIKAVINALEMLERVSLPRAEEGMARKFKALDG